MAPLRSPASLRENAMEYRASNSPLRSGTGSAGSADSSGISGIGSGASSWTGSGTCSATSGGSGSGSGSGTGTWKSSSKGASSSGSGTGHWTGAVSREDSAAERILEYSSRMRSLEGSILVAMPRMCAASQSMPRLSLIIAMRTSGYVLLRSSSEARRSAFSAPTSSPRASRTAAFDIQYSGSSGSMARALS